MLTGKIQSTSSKGDFYCLSVLLIVREGFLFEMATCWSSVYLYWIKTLTTLALFMNAFRSWLFVTRQLAKQNFLNFSTGATKPRIQFDNKLATAGHWSGLKTDLRYIFVSGPLQPWNKALIPGAWAEYVVFIYAVMNSQKYYLEFLLWTIISSRAYLKTRRWFRSI